MDPVRVLDLVGANPTSYVNGQVPVSVLCPATSDGHQMLRCDAAVAYRLMSSAYEEQTGASPCITDSYRSHAAQEQVFRVKPGLAATPGTSIHGFGAAADLCGGVEVFDSPEHLWMLAHGTAFGWHAPSWAMAGGSRPEPWHFEYAPTRWVID